MNLFLTLTGLFLVYKFFYSLGVGLIPDEAYYWEWSRNLDLSYYDQGPGTAYYIKLFTSVFGNNIFALRLASFSGFIICLFLIYKSISILEYTNTEKKRLLIFLILVPAFFGGSIFILHDTVLHIFWASAIFFIISYLKTKKNIFIYLLFISLSLGALSKHTMVFFAIVLILWAIISKERFLFRNIHFYIAFGIAFLLIAPLIYWNVQHNWENVDAILNLRSSGGANYKKNNLIPFLVAQSLAISPFWFIGLIYLGIKKLIEFKKNSQFDSTEIFLILISLFLPIFFLCLSLIKEIQGNWLFPSYLGLSILISKDKIFEDKIYSNLMRWGLLPVLILNLYSFYSVEIISFFKIKLDSHFIPGYRDRGFKEISENLKTLKYQIDKNANTIANRYQDAAILSWYEESQKFVPSINILQKNQYNHWNKLEVGKNYFLIFIQENTCVKSPTFFTPYLKFMFEEVKNFEEKEIMENGIVIKRYQIWYLKNYKRVWSIPIQEFISNRLIEELMPNLKGKNPYVMKNPMKAEDISILTDYLDKKGETQCRLF